ncbi:nucleotidyltransferase domain-containing protein [Kitasatospora phosalacinea]|uniref:Uncharacterized protein n=1 Tax=Kitasatospora phosalacinea TaxID=2065 RepID=A0A9W6PKV4_9ACTN|nr:hypothetical protein Kpho01_48710 [Kitasatospora phosalacinea]
MAADRPRRQSARALNGTDLLEVLDPPEGAGATARVGGGWGVDALIGRTTRTQADLDLVVRSDRLDAVRGALVGAGFTEALRDWLPAAPAPHRPGRGSSAPCAGAGGSNYRAANGSPARHR